MSEMEGFSAPKAEEGSVQEIRFNPMAVSAHEGNIGSSQKNEGQAYLIGEVPQQYSFDPNSFLPLNSDRLVGSVNYIEKVLGDVAQMIEQEVVQIQKHQKKISFWEDRIEKNRSLILRNQSKIQQNNADISYDKKNRDYWWSLAEELNLDFQAAQAANRKNDWSWLVKKYGLKSANGTMLDVNSSAIEELANGEINNLAAQYRNAGNKYDQAKKDREAENNRLIRENGACMNTNEQLQGFITNAYANEIEPLQDGVLMLKELGVKMKSLNNDSSKAVYGELRAWAQQFLNDFLKSNPRVTQSLVTEFRKLTSIPLPADRC